MTAQPDMLGITADATPESLVEQDLRDPSSAKWPRELAAMVAVVEAAFVRAGLPATDAIELATTGVLAIGEYRGGRLVYIPRGDALRTGLRHIKAWRMWRGNNIEDVMAFLGVTEVRAYKVLAEQRALHSGKLQRRLFKD